ncbi:protein translocase subunit SecF [Actinoallomurus iriomotensis]|uniref:Protein-export membrane protein SecF n=1 Tax=Actinoallomurus iriomotensis TaxID=478107 RepID=A0A9W6SBD1_9ACTN|nr:protein translocase subunit SecF [Actinoallomurus iriomotensis]GLY90479.1 protein translocase subunit SecF [Actinoallomurus iriomotensis]
MSRLGTIGGRLHRGEISLNFVGRQKLWYSISGLILVISVVSLLTLGLNFGVEFKGGTVFQFPTKPGTTTSDARTAVTDSGVVKEDPIVQKTGTGWRVQTESLTSAQVTKVQETVQHRFGLPKPDDVSPQSVGASWGKDISQKALQGLVIFLVAIIIYLSIAFEWRMAVAALIALAHDILITIGVYSLVQFEVTPSSVVGLLTILGYSLYDTVVVFDKVRENTRPLLTTKSMTYSQAANLGLNQTLVRSINTSVIALLPVAGLLFIGAGVMGAGTLKDLALVLFVGMLAGAYSSICIATPILADLQERQAKYRDLAKRVKSKAGSAKRQSRAANAEATAKPAADAPESEPQDTVPGEEEGDAATSVGAGIRLVQQGPRQQPRRTGSKGHPSGKKKR